MKKLLTAVLIALLGFLPSCAWIGRTTGKTKAKMERKANDMERAYHQGYADERSKIEKLGLAPEKGKAPAEKPALPSKISKANK
ncbi:MAG: hypothetical protein LBS77_04595 [Desulfovibrio sp.]|jgi:hypothetical protein|nr:hypothetical protein [Desulfovibrio sp.]